MEYVMHPWIQPNVLEQRAYQDAVMRTALTGNTLCVLPTGMGKTNIAALVVAHRLAQNMHAKILFLAPTKPLVEQHRATFERMLKIGPSELVVVTGETDAGIREKKYAAADIIFSTPETVRNDLTHGLLSLRNVSLCIIDEAHRAVGNYAYTSIARRYLQEAAEPLILALTASPGSTRTHIQDVKKNLYIDHVEIRSREDADVRPYVHVVTKDFIEVPVPDAIRSILDYLATAKNERVAKLLAWKVIASDRVGKSQLLALQDKLIRENREAKKGIAMAAVSMIAQVIKLDHALLLAETQCLAALNSYLFQLESDSTKAAARLLADANVQKATRLVTELLKEGQEHPKMDALKTIVAEQLSTDKDSRIIVFANYRDTVAAIARALAELDGAGPIEFIGQAKKKGKGLSQKEQVQILNEFKMGFYNILCASQVAEEGLDVVETNLVVFYEPTPSAIRTIQRKGRTARTHEGRVVILIAKDTRDEAFHWASRHKERTMTKTLYAMQRQADLSGFAKDS